MDWLLYSCSIKPALLRQASYGTLKLGFYQYLKKIFTQRPEEQKLLHNIIFACVSGASANGINYFKY